MKELIKGEINIQIKKRAAKSSERLITGSNDQCRRCSTWAFQRRREINPIENDLLRLKIFMQKMKRRRQRVSTRKRAEMAQDLSVPPICWLFSSSSASWMWKFLLKESSTFDTSSKRPDEMISPYSIIFISPLRCRNRWPAWPATFVALSSSFLLLLLSPCSLFIWPVDREEFQCKSPGRPPALIDANIIFFVCVSLSGRERESVRTRKGITCRTSGRRRRRKENRCKTYHLFHMYPAAHKKFSYPASRWLAWRHVSFTWSRTVAYGDVLGCYFAFLFFH